MIDVKFDLNFSFLYFFYYKLRIKNSEVGLLRDRT